MMKNKNIDTPKNNNCKIYFSCDNTRECVYHSGLKCIYNFDGQCNSIVARLNKMVLEIENMTEKKVVLI